MSFLNLQRSALLNSGALLLATLSLGSFVPVVSQALISPACAQPAGEQIAGFAPLSDAEKASFVAA